MPANSLKRTPKTVVLFGVFEADLRSDELHKNGVKVRIQDLPFRALKLLLSRPHEVITREEFRQALWPGDVFVDFDLGIRSAIKRLRDALGDSAENPIFVETVDRRGYRWIAATHVSEAASAARTTPESEDSDPASGAKASAVETPAADSATPTTKMKKTAWIVGLAGGLAIVMAVVLLRESGWKQRLFGNPDSGVLRSVAVLPFENAGSDKDADFLRVALPDEVANVLSYVPSLSIRPFATTSRYSGPNLDLQQAGREMGVASIITGHYLIAGDQLEVTLEAVDVANNRSVWRDTVSVAASDKIAMREQITSQVRQGLVPAIGGSSAPWEAGTRPKSEEAYDLYLRSIAVPHDVAPKRTGSSWREKDAIAMLERAVGIDPGYAPAWAALGMRYYYDAIFGGGGEAMLKRSDSAFERALALDPNLISAAGALITNQADRGNLGPAYAQAAVLAKQRPESASAHFVLGYVLRYAGLLDEAARECDAAIQRDRGNYQFRSCSWVFSRLGEPQRAMEFVRLDAGSDWAARQTAFILIGQGKLAEARHSIQRASHTPLMGHDLLQACLDPQQASQLEGRAQEVETAALAGVDAEPRYVFGTLLSYCGQKDAALRLLRSAIEHNYCAYQSLQSDPLLVKLRGTPEFSELLSAAKECQGRFLQQREQNPHSK
jgi:DNA-binding winged helix-turn-helix (wHTH) protein/TolB-like protein/tetratricopeptide (TPR) repeat protein